MLEEKSSVLFKISMKSKNAYEAMRESWLNPYSIDVIFTGSMIADSGFGHIQDSFD